MAAARKIHIIGIGDDGLDGVTAGARRLIDEAELLLGTEATLAKVPQSKAQRCVLCGQSRPGRRAALEARRQAGGGAGLGRSAVLWRGPLSLRQARQRLVRRGAARQQHAVGLRPGERKLGRSVSDEPGQPPAGTGGRADSHGHDGRACSPASSIPPAAVARGAAGPADRLLFGLCLRESRFARRTRDAWRTGRNCRRAVFGR